MCTPATRAIGSGADRGRILGWFRVAEALTAIPAHAVILDAELCLLRADGSPDFYRLQAAIGGRQHELAVFGRAPNESDEWVDVTNPFSPRPTPCIARWCSGQML